LYISDNNDIDIVVRFLSLGTCNFSSAYTFTTINHRHRQW